jgi:hypothetical protein
MARTENAAAQGNSWASTPGAGVLSTDATANQLSTHNSYYLTIISTGSVNGSNHVGANGETALTFTIDEGGSVATDVSPAAINGTTGCFSTITVVMQLTPVGLIMVPLLISQTSVPLQVH